MKSDRSFSHWKQQKKKTLMQSNKIKRRAKPRGNPMSGRVESSIVAAYLFLLRSDYVSELYLENYRKWQNLVGGGLGRSWWVSGNGNLLRFQWLSGSRLGTGGRTLYVKYGKRLSFFFIFILLLLLFYFLREI